MAASMFVLAALALFMALFAMNGFGAAGERPPRRPAIVLAAFGTTDVEALDSIMNVLARVEKAFPDHDVRLAFTSGMIRRVWRERAADAGFRRANPDVPDAIYRARSPLSVLASVQEAGARPTLVQSLHIADGEEYADLVNLVKALGNIETAQASRRPFPLIGVGEPALGVDAGRDGYLERAAGALAHLAREARESESALVLMAHGNERLNQDVFARFEAVMREKYGPQVFIGTVEARPFAEDIAEGMGKGANPPRRVFLAPLMLVAGDHVRNDMAGEDGWAGVFRERGLAVKTRVVGLGSDDSWADIYVERLGALGRAVTPRMR